MDSSAREDTTTEDVAPTFDDLLGGGGAGADTGAGDGSDLV